MYFWKAKDQIQNFGKRHGLSMYFTLVLTCTIIVDISIYFTLVLTCTIIVDKRHIFIFYIEHFNKI
ncbi:hypothetical protein Hdeb2414_s0041g00737701 [Helianthus debilis subsp. tardiflorus]